MNVCDRQHILSFSDAVSKQAKTPDPVELIKGTSDFVTKGLLIYTQIRGQVGGCFPRC